MIAETPGFDAELGCPSMASQYKVIALTHGTKVAALRSATN
jgi:hypothetical protein